MVPPVALRVRTLLVDEFDPKRLPSDPSDALRSFFALLSCATGLIETARNDRANDVRDVRGQYRLSCVGRPKRF